MPLTNAEPNMDNYVPFTANIQSAKASKVTKDFDVAAIKTLNVINSNAWQVVGVDGSPKIANDRAIADVNSLMVGINTATGAPVTLFKADADSNDQMFTLMGNRVATHVELTSSISAGRVSYSDIPANPAFAVMNNSATAAIAFPVETAATKQRVMPAGWSLMTAAGTTVPSEATMIIFAGNNNEVKTWVKGETAPSWLKAGTPVFVYLEKAITDFTFFK
jgi:hypothetical protein